MPCSRYEGSSCSYCTLIVDLPLQTDVTLPLNVFSTRDLYKPKSDVKLPSTDKLEAFRRLILSAKTGGIEVTDTISEVQAEPWLVTSRLLIFDCHTAYTRRLCATEEGGQCHFSRRIETNHHSCSVCSLPFVQLHAHMLTVWVPVRLIGLTKHESTVTVEGWEYAKELNKRRKARFA